MYLDYETYKTKTNTWIDEMAFNDTLKKAESIIDLHTFNRLRDHWDNLDDYFQGPVQDALVELVNKLDADNNSKTIQSESVGSWSVSYDTSSNSAKSDKEIITRHLVHTGLLYRGGGLMWS